MAGAAIAKFENELERLADRYAEEVEKLQREARREPTPLAEAEAARAAERFLQELEEDVAVLEKSVDGLHSRATTSAFFNFPKIIAEVSEEYHSNQRRIEQWLASSRVHGSEEVVRESTRLSSPSDSPGGLLPPVSPSALSLSPVHKSSHASGTAASKGPVKRRHKASPAPEPESPTPPDGSLPASPVPPSPLGHERAAETTSIRYGGVSIAPFDELQVAELVPAYLSTQIGYDELQALVERVNEALQAEQLGDIVTESDLQRVLGNYGKVKALILILLKLRRVKSHRESNELAFRITTPAK